MINDNSGLSSLNEKDKTDAFDSDQKANHNGEHTVEVQGTTFTEDELKEANKPQRNVILNTIGGSGISGTSESDSGFRDTERVNTRANEAPDSTDTNTGGLSAGGGKGASQS